MKNLKLKLFNLSQEKDWCYEKKYIYNKKNYRLSLFKN